MEQYGFIHFRSTFTLFNFFPLTYLLGLSLAENILTFIFQQDKDVRFTFWGQNVNDQRNGAIKHSPANIRATVYYIPLFR